MATERNSCVPEKYKNSRYADCLFEWVIAKYKDKEPEILNVNTDSDNFWKIVVDDLWKAEQKKEDSTLENINDIHDYIDFCTEGFDLEDKETWRPVDINKIEHSRDKAQEEQDERIRQMLALEEEELRKIKEEKEQARKEEEKKAEREKKRQERLLEISQPKPKYKIPTALERTRQTISEYGDRGGKKNINIYYDALVKEARLLNKSHERIQEIEGQRKVALEKNAKKRFWLVAILGAPLWYYVIKWALTIYILILLTPLILGFFVGSFGGLLRRHK